MGTKSVVQYLRIIYFILSQLQTREKTKFYSYILHKHVYDDIIIRGTSTIFRLIYFGNALIVYLQ